MKKISFLILAMSFIMSCDSIRVTSDFNENIEFSDLKTYAFSKKGIDKVKMNDIDKKRILKGKELNVSFKKRIGHLVNI